MTASGRLIWLNGKVVSVDQATVNVLSPTAQYGINVFEGLRCYWNEERKQLFGFRVPDHMRRLLQSARLLRLDFAHDEDFLIQSFRRIVTANAFREDIAARVTLYLDGDGTWSSSGPVGMFIAPIPKGRYLDDSKPGISCCVSSWERICDRDFPPRVKAGANYLNSRLGQMEALRNGYDSALFLNRRGTLAEGPGSCLFIVREGKLVTPPGTASVLESITRKTIETLARDELDIEVVEREIDRTEIHLADEAFLCGTAVEIVPITSVDGLAVGDGSEGALTLKLRNLYFSVARGIRDSCIPWLFPIYAD